MILPLEAPWREARTPVIACGSNGAPGRLVRKFAGSGARIPVTPAWLHDWAVVYSAHFTSYGALPATLHRCPGARTRLCVTWLTAAQLELMHRSEGAGERYDYALLERLERLEPEVEGHGAIDRAGAYLSRRGPPAQDGQAVRLAGHGNRAMRRIGMVPGARAARSVRLVSAFAAAPRSARRAVFAAPRCARSAP
jgi:hypothetical protein